MGGLKTYECSSDGDKRFSAFYARLEDGRSIEEHYQCDVKGYDPGGTNWKKGKGRPALNPAVDLPTEYRWLWLKYFRLHPALAEEIKKISETYVLVDKFSRGPVDQASAIMWLIRNNHI